MINAALRPLWYFSRDIYRLLDDSKSLQVARWRYTLLKQDPKYQGVRELVQALDLLAEPKLTRVMAFVRLAMCGELQLCLPAEMALQAASAALPPASALRL